MEVLIQPASLARCCIVAPLLVFGAEASEGGEGRGEEERSSFVLGLTTCSCVVFVVVSFSAYAFLRFYYAHSKPY